MKGESPDTGAFWYLHRASRLIQVLVPTYGVWSLYSDDSDTQ